MFIEKLEIILKEKNITMNKLSKEIGYSQSAISNWKKGRMPQINVLQKVCKYLNVSADYLLDLDDTPPPPNLTDQEGELLKDFRRCGPETKRNIMILASAGAQEAEKEKTSSNLKNIG